MILSRIPGVGSVTNNSTRVRIGYRIYSLWRFTAAADYNYNDHYSTGSFSDPTDETALRWRFTSRTHWRRLTSATDWRRLTPKADGRGLTLCIVFPSLTLSATMETLALLLLVTMQRNNTGVVSVLRLRLPSNDGVQSNTSQYYVCNFVDKQLMFSANPQIQKINCFGGESTSFCE
jgi:hypothetical protein